MRYLKRIYPLKSSWFVECNLTAQRAVFTPYYGGELYWSNIYRINDPPNKNARVIHTNKAFIFNFLRVVEV